MGEKVLELFSVVREGGVLEIDRCIFGMWIQ